MMRSTPGSRGQALPVEALAKTGTEQQKKEYVWLQKSVLNWFDQHGRKHLPWQQKPTPYHVWVSEIMLQQTQVTTVISYFERFIESFPDICCLADAPIDTVLAHWSGLGYYARARNLHRTAQIIQQQFAGVFPADVETLQSLPGIGRSTAGAILSLGLNIRAPILDGNVKRVLCRFFAIDEPPTKPNAIKKLWEIAENYTPEKRYADYTQVMMDLGALICTRTKPKCDACPLQKKCLAYLSGNPTQYPIGKPKKNIPVRAIHFLIIQNSNGDILLEKRPPSGIWGGLWSLPEIASLQDISVIFEKYHLKKHTIEATLPVHRHTFSHFHLHITPVLVKVDDWRPPLMEYDSIIWHNPQHLNQLGLAAPVKLVLSKTTRI